MDTQSFSHVPKNLISHVYREDNTRIRGHVFAPDALDRRFTVEYSLDGYVLGVSYADEFVEHLWREDHGDGCYGFSFPTPRYGFVGRLDVRLANDGRVIGSLEGDGPIGEVLPLVGQALWQGNLQISGWVATDEDAQLVSFVVDGITVHTERAGDWSPIHRGLFVEGARFFDVALPRHLADGRIKSVHIYGASGRELSGSPVALLAFPDPLWEIVSKLDPAARDDVRIGVYEKLFPQSVPFDEWQAWARAWLRPCDLGAPDRVAVVIIGDDQACLRATLESLENDGDVSWLAAVLPSPDGWTFEPSELEGFLLDEGKECDVVVLARYGAIFHEGGLPRLVGAFESASAAEIVYPDVCRGGVSHDPEPLVWTIFDYERFLEQGYFADIFAIRRSSLLRYLGKARASLFGIVFALIEDSPTAGEASIFHLPGMAASINERPGGFVLAREVDAHLRRCGKDARANVPPQAGDQIARIMRPSIPLSTTVIITASADEAALLSCIEAVRRTSLGPPPHILIATGNTRVADIARSSELATVLCSTVHDRAGLINAALGHVNTTHVCILDANIKPLSADWLHVLEGLAIQSGVGCVGGLITRADGRVSHAGYVLGMRPLVSVAFEGADSAAGVYGDLLNVTHGVSALSMRATLLRMDLVRELGGFDQADFPQHLRDVHFCLRLGERGYRIVLDPHVRFLDTGAPETGVARPSPADELLLARFRHRWSEKLGNDPYYSPILNAGNLPFSSLAWPPRSLAARARRNSQDES